MAKIDRLAITLITCFSLVIGAVIWGGQSCIHTSSCLIHVGPKVRQFSWHQKTIGAEDQAFLISFDRPMDHGGVESNLVIEPPLPGKFSWAGKNLAYTLTESPVYGREYQVSLRGAQEKFLGTDRLGATMLSFLSGFQVRDRAFAYIGTAGTERGRLALYNLSRQEQRILTPDDLVVMEFAIDRQGKSIWFTAYDRKRGDGGFQEASLYRITTGLNGDQKVSLEKIVDSQDYHNLDFQLESDGLGVVVRRVNRNDPLDFGLWRFTVDGQNQVLTQKEGGDFRLTPDDQAVAIAQGEGIAIVPLAENADPLDFLSRFGQVLAFSRDGRQAAMVNFNTDKPELIYTRSLYVVNNQNQEREVLNTQGSLIDAAFSYDGETLYAIVSQLAEGSEYQEIPYIVEIDLTTQTIKTLATLPPSPDLRFSLASDDSGILFSQIMRNPNPTARDLTTSGGEAIASSQVWLLLPDHQGQNHSLEQLPFAGVHPQWLP